MPSMSSKKCPVDVELLLSQAQSRMTQLKKSIRERKLELREAKITCDACGQENDDKKPLQTCIRCRTVRYCNRECQIAHFNATHKADCKAFKHPPRCRAFDVTAFYPGCTHPDCPVFAHTHSAGIGCWVTSSGTIDCGLKGVAGDYVELDNRPRGAPIAFSAEKMLRNFMREDGYYLALHVIVQNRMGHKNAAPMVVVGSSILAIGSAEGTPVLLEGKLDGEQNVMLEELDGSSVVALAPVFVTLSYFNGKYIMNNDHPAVVDKVTSSVALKMGDFAIFEVQYRCGGPRIRRDFKAIERLQRLSIPATPFDPTFRGPYTELISSAAEKGCVCLLDAKIDQASVADWYSDYKTKGQDEHIRTHYGEEKMQLAKLSMTTISQQLKQFQEGLMGSGLFDKGPETFDRHFELFRKTMLRKGSFPATLGNEAYCQQVKLMMRALAHGAEIGGSSRAIKG
ncbi:hypothetical protein Hypma_001808 [Hypsizygus marmoreus]|uniref:MYND-type domain-containing protein n=1 Tax=Hypsizygus marmoreus TaxID=39966 RepID=A0A369J556_HYPMA|nr:hypothetical protein Hypma_001808 [Hypsizygus marmoreus]